ncbi:MAG TPA: hypothetical protein VFL66_11605 [Gaiellaceae bacterium]|nr:hypothetical protein [Gaiellaceae bacterium]
MRVQRLLDLAREDVVAAADDQLLQPVDEVEVAVAVEAADVAGAQPAVRGERRGARGRVLPVARDHRGPAELHLAELAEPHLAAAERHPDRAGPPLLALHVRRRDPGELGQAVALVDLAAEDALELGRDLDRNRGAADVGDPHRRQLGRRARRLAERDAHRRHAEQDRRPRRRHRRERPLGVEAADDGDGAAGEEGGDEPGREAEHVRERRRAEDDVVRPERERVGRVLRSRADAAVGEDRALRPARRARGVENRRRLGGPARRDLHERRAIGELALAEQQPRPRGGDPRLDLRRGEQRVQRHRDRAEPQHAEPRGDEAGAVAEEQRDAVARLDAARPQRGRRRPRAPLELAVGDRAALLHERRPRRVGRRRDLRQVHTP